MVKAFITFSIMSLIFMASGCQMDPVVTDPQREQSNTWIIQSHYQQQTRNALIRQHTVYPYHFEAGSAALNRLGHSDVAVLAEHYRKHPGTLNVRRGDGSDKLHQARVEAVRSVLQDHGVHPDRIRIAEGQAGGDGVTSEHTITVLSVKNEVWQPYND